MLYLFWFYFCFKKCYRIVITSLKCSPVTSNIIWNIVPFSFHIGPYLNYVCLSNTLISIGHSIKDPFFWGPPRRPRMLLKSMDLVRSQKLNNVGHGEYLDAYPHGNKFFLKSRPDYVK